LTPEEEYVFQVDSHLAEHQGDDDPEAFHCGEDGLYEMGFEMIANGVADPKKIARAALRLAKADLTRWYA
jgi:hypothetical protein